MYRECVIDMVQSGDGKWRTAHDCSRPVASSTALAFPDSVGAHERHCPERTPLYAEWFFREIGRLFHPSSCCSLTARVQTLDVTREDLLRPGTVIQLGLPPRRIDLLIRITGVEFEDAWRGRVEQVLEGCSIAYLGRADLVANKRATSTGLRSSSAITGSCSAVGMFLRGASS